MVASHQIGIRVGGVYVDPADWFDRQVELTPPPDCARTGVNAVDVMLIIDSSGSMSGNDPLNKRVQAALTYLAASGVGDRVGVVDFDHEVKLLSGLREARIENQQNQELVAAINSIDSFGDTNIRDGITVACQELTNQGQAARRGAILLTDGQHNRGPFGTPQQCFADKGWPIYAFGFGQASQGLLETVASDTGGESKFLNLNDVTNLICEFQGVRSRIAGDTPKPCLTLHLEPSEIKTTSATLQAEQDQATFSTSWGGSDIVMTLTTPSGRVIDRSTDALDVLHDQGPTFEVYSITDPESGDWKVDLFAADVPPEGEDVVFGFTTIPSADAEPPPPEEEGEIDIEVTDLYALYPPICAGPDIVFRASLRNNGSKESGPFLIRFIADNSDTFDGGHPSEPAGATGSHDHGWRPYLSPGEHTLEFIADFDDQIPETDEDNNTGTLTFTAEDCSDTQATITVPGTQPWTDTGIDLNQGDQVTFTASGTIKISPADPGTTPAGSPDCIALNGRQLDKNSENWLTPGLSCWSLVGRTGEDGAPFQIGTSLSFPVETAGRLYFGVNDEIGRFGNNSGSWTVDITVSDAPAESSLAANAGSDQTVPGPSPVAVQFDGSGSTGDIVRYQWYNQWGLLLAEGVTPVIEVNFGHTDPQPGTTRTFTLVVADAQGNTAQDKVTITLGETPEEDEG
jgi:hypothetical protein